MLFTGIMLFIFFSARERAEFNKPCYLIGSWEGPAGTHLVFRERV